MRCECYNFLHNPSKICTPGFKQYLIKFYVKSYELKCTEKVETIILKILSLDIHPVILKLGRTTADLLI